MKRKSFLTLVCAVLSTLCFLHVLQMMKMEVGLMAL